MIKTYNINGNMCFRIKDIAGYIGFNKGKYDRLVKNIKSDFILQNYVLNGFTDTNGGKQECYFILCNMLYMLLCKINYCSFSNDEQIKKYNILLNYSSGLKHITVFDNREIYSYESHLRDEIYNSGNLNDIKIINKEVNYNFGRIDLLGVDQNNLTCCIELKKYTEYKYLNDQLLRYKKSGLFDRIIYIGYSISDKTVEFCKNNNIEIYTYKRDINYSKVV